MENRDGPQRCDQCGFYFKNQAILHMHQMYHHGKFIGPMVSSDTDTEDGTNSGKSDGPQRCDQCDEDFKNRTILHMHQILCHRIAFSHMVSSDTDTEDVTNRGKSDTKPTLRSPGASGNDGNTSSTPQEPPSSQLEDVQSPESLSKRGRTTSFNDVKTSSRTGSMYRYPHCNYSPDKSTSPTRRVLMRRNRSLSRSAQARPLATPPTARYCENCHIQFQFLEYYKIHKELYCNTPHDHKSTSSSSPSTSQHQTTQQQTPSQTRSSRNQISFRDPSAKAGYNMALNQPLNSAISTSPLIPDPCSSLDGGGNLSPSLVPAGNIAIPDTQASSPDRQMNVIPSFTVMPGTEANEVQTSEESSRTKLSEGKDTSASKEDRLQIPMQKDDKNQDGGKDEGVPLDHSRRMKEWDEKSLPSISMTQSGLQRPSSSRDECNIPPNLPAMPPHNAELMETESELISVLQPPILVKQDVHKCMHCNIVFDKYENYLLHSIVNFDGSCSVKNRQEDSPDKSRNSSSTPERDETNE